MPYWPRNYDWLIDWIIWSAKHSQLRVYNNSREIYWYQSNRRRTISIECYPKWPKRILKQTCQVLLMDCYLPSFHCSVSIQYDLKYRAMHLSTSRSIEKLKLIVPQLFFSFFYETFQPSISIYLWDYLFFPHCRYRFGTLGESSPRPVACKSSEEPLHHLKYICIFEVYECWCLVSYVVYMMQLYEHAL